MSIAAVTNETTLQGTRPLWSRPRISGVEERLTSHLQAWLGEWPAAGGFHLLVWPGRDEPGWDGGSWPGLGVENPQGTLLSLSPTLVPAGRAIDIASVTAAVRAPDATTAVPALLGRPDLRFGRAVFRWTAQPAQFPEVGEWVDPADPRLPSWLRPFNGGALVAWDEQGRYAAGVGVKRHNRFAQELAVATEPAHRGRGLARLLVAQAARRSLAQGAVPLYLHETDNPASAKVADAAGFSDQGWRVVALFPAPSLAV